MFEVAEAYEATMGRWSRQLARLFVEFVGVRDGDKVLDVGCGTGSMSAMRRPCLTRTLLSTDAWPYSRLTVSRMLRRPR
ncbi:MAG: hypothetical protein WCH75_01745 [Candidatus Binatia bacterium]